MCVKYMYIPLGKKINIRMICTKLSEYQSKWTLNSVLALFADNQSSHSSTTPKTKNQKVLLRRSYVLTLGFTRETTVINLSCPLILQASRTWQCLSQSHCSSTSTLSRGPYCLKGVQNQTFTPLTSRTFSIPMIQVSEK